MRPVARLAVPLVLAPLASLAPTAAAAGDGAGMGADVDLLPFRVTDAELSRSLGRLVAVSTTPAGRIHVWDPVAQSGIAADLPLAPLSVSVSPDGLQAVVGHDGWISHVDVATATVLDTIPVSCIVGDVVLGPNGYAYAFPSTGQWVSMRCVELATGVETLGAGTIRHGTRAKLHPNGLRMYGADNGLSPSDIEKYDIEPGTSALLYDSPYHGDYGMGGDLWMSEDGLRIFVRAGNVFRSSEVQAEDMIYNGNLSELSTAVWIDHSSEANKVLAIPEAPLFGGSGSDTELQVYGYDFLAFEGAHAFPTVDLGGTDYATHGRYVFLEADGKRAWAVVEVDASSGLLLDHGLVAFTLEPEIDALSVDVEAVSVAAGGVQTLSLDAGDEHAGRTYLLLGSTNGAVPGIPIGGVVLPLNFEFGWFLYTLTAPNHPPLVDSLGVLDALGRATAAIDLGPGVAPAALAGTVAHHAFLVLDAGAVVFASNATVLQLEP